MSRRSATHEQTTSDAPPESRDPSTAAEIVRVPDLETMQRFDRPGPRYTSYPTAVEFHEGVGEEQYLSRLAAADAEGSDEPLSLYVHLPFCEKRCRFCACHVIATERRDVAKRYLDYLLTEIDLVAAALPTRRRAIQMHWGGGTPTYLSPEEIELLFRHLSASFPLLDGAEVAIEVDPRVTTRAHLETLAALGFNRLSLGVQDLDATVQEAIGRGQTEEETRTLIDTAREIGFAGGINIDLIYGLPRQTLDGFRAALRGVLGLDPDRLAVYSFAYVPWIKVNQRKIDQELLPAAEEKLRLYLEALSAFTGAGYEAIGMDHFAKPADELTRASREGRLARNFMGYTVKPATAAIGLGVSAIGDLSAGYFQNVKKLSHYYRALDDGRLPIERGYLLDADDRLRRHVITEIMCNFRIVKDDVERRFGVRFDDYFADELRELTELRGAAFVTETADALRVTPAGRLFVRNVAMVFDRYLQEKLAQRPVFSRTI